jgi:hypothetical protein
MSAPLWIIVAVVVVVVVVGLLLLLRVARRPRLRALPVQSRERYAANWRAIEARFVDEPKEAVREADRLVQEMLRERGATLEERRMPDHFRRARMEAQGGDGGSSTEGLRRAMLHYREIVTAGVGNQVRRSDAGRREVAS